MIETNTYTMNDIRTKLVKDMGDTYGTALYLWYCGTYNLADTDTAPKGLVEDILGIYQ